MRFRFTKEKGSFDSKSCLYVAHRSLIIQSYFPLCNFRSMDYMWLWICCQFMQVRYRVFAWLLSQWMFDLLFTEFSTWMKLSRSVHTYGFEVIYGVLLNFSSARDSLVSIYIFYSAMDDKVSFVFNILNSWEKRRWFIIWQYMDLSCMVMELEFG